VSRFVRLLAVLPALGGFAAACLLVPDGQALQVPTVTVTTPTVSVPAPVPVPPTPTATVTVAPPTVAPPTVTTPTVPTATTPTLPSPPPVRIAPPPPPRAPSPTTIVPVPAPGTTGPVRISPSPSTSSPSSPAPSPTRAPAPGGSGSAPAPGWGSGGSQSGSESPGGVVVGVAGAATTRRGGAAPNRSRALAARPHRTKNRVSVRLRFALPAAGRLFLIVRGPAPSCRVAGVIPFRGRRGTNTIYFAGRVQGRRLDPGLYQLSLSTTRRPQPGAPATAVRVVSVRRSVPVARPGLLGSCTPAQAFFDDGTRRILVSEAVARKEQARQRPTASVVGLPSVELEPPKQGGAAGSDDELAGGLLPDPGDVGGGSADGGLESFAAIGVLLIIASLLFGMVVLVTRFLRGNWNP